MDSELSPARVADNAPPDQPIAFPWFESREAPILFRLGGGVFSSGPFCIRPPPGTAPEMRPHWIIVPLFGVDPVGNRSEAHTSELQSLMRISFTVFCLKTIIRLDT